MTRPGTAVHPAGGRAGGARRRRTSGDAGRWLPIVLVGLAVLAGLAWGTEDPAVPAEGCAMAGVPLTAEQVANAAVIAQVGRDRGLPDRAIVIALATAQQESRLRNLDYGDRDSLGLFQQRPSQGWGTEAQVQDPVYAAGKFYDGLVEVPGWETARLTDAAQAVQLSGYPAAYQQWEPLAQSWAYAILGGGEGAIICGPDSAG